MCERRYSRSIWNGAGCDSTQHRHKVLGTRRYGPCCGCGEDDCLEGYHDCALYCDHARVISYSCVFPCRCIDVGRMCFSPSLRGCAQHQCVVCCWHEAECRGNVRHRIVDGCCEAIDVCYGNRNESLVVAFAHLTNFVRLCNNGHKIQSHRSAASDLHGAGCSHLKFVVDGAAVHKQYGSHLPQHHRCWIREHCWDLECDWGDYCSGHLRKHCKHAHCQCHSCQYNQCDRERNMLHCKSDCEWDRHYQYALNERSNTGRRHKYDCSHCQRSAELCLAVYRCHCGKRRLYSKRLWDKYISRAAQYC